MRTQHSAPALAGALLALAGVLTGCGIRPTSVPVDAGAAPSRVSCTLPPTASPTASPTATATVTATATATETAATAARSSQDSRARTERQRVGQASVQIYLVCSDEVTAVRRTLPAPIGGSGAADRLAAAHALLDQLQAKPDENESVAGFTTDVPGDLDVAGPRRGDPSTALRLSDEQDALPSFALAQIVCTFARTAATSGATSGTTSGTTSGATEGATSGATDGSVVLGFADGGAARRFSCTSDLRTRSEVSQTAGTAVR